MNENVIVTQKLNVPKEKIWNALTDKEQMKEWYFDIPDFELEIHKIFHFYEPGNEKKYHHQCEILEIIPNKKLKHTWFYPEFSNQKSIVNWDLEDLEDDTLVTITHENLDNFKDLGKDFQKESFQQGWTEILGKSLKDFIKK